MGIHIWDFPVMGYDRLWIIGVMWLEVSFVEIILAAHVGVRVRLGCRVMVGKESLYQASGCVNGRGYYLHVFIKKCF